MGYNRSRHGGCGSRDNQGFLGMVILRHGLWILAFLGLIVLPGHLAHAQTATAPGKDAAVPTASNSASGQGSTGSPNADKSADATTASADVSLSAEQAKLAGKYKELERVILRMAEVMQTTDPKRAALLRQTFAQSKQKQIDLQYEDLVKLLQQEQLYQASKNQVAVEQDLNQLLQLLLSGEREKQIPTERTEIKRFIDRINKLIREQQGLEGETEGQGDPADLIKQQEGVANKTGQLSQDLKKFDEVNNPTANGDEKPSDAEKSDGKNSDDKGSPSKQSGDKNSDAKNSAGSPSDSGEKSTDGKQPDNAKPGDKSANGKKSDQSDKGESSNSSDGKSDQKPGDKSNQPANGKSGQQSNDKSGKKSADQKSADQKSQPDKSNAERNQKKPTDQKNQKSDEKSNNSEKSSGGQQEQENKSNPSQSQSQNGKQQNSKQQNGQPNDSGGEDSQPQDNQSPDGPQSSEENPSARKRIRQAEDRMREAKRQLEQAQRRGAAQEQQHAIEELKQAKSQLEEILRQLREEEVERVLAQLEGRFRKMLQSQIEVYEGTISLDGIPDDERDRDLEIEAGKLSHRENDIITDADKTLALLREEGSSVAFPESVEQMREDMAQTSARLGRANVGQMTQGIEQDVVKSLEEMIAALQKAQKDQRQRSGNGGAGGGAGGNQDQPLLDSIAELKMIRALQVRVNTRTERYSKLLQDGTEQADAPDLLEAIQRLSEREQRIYKTTRDIVVGKNK
jgi:hypothetical protein